MTEEIQVQSPWPGHQFPPRVEAAMTVAARLGVRLAPDVAERIADAVLECADTEHRVRIQIAPELWPQARETALRRLGAQLAQDLVVRKLLPTALPREVVQRSVHKWDVLTVELVVPVRFASGG